VTAVLHRPASLRPDAATACWAVAHENGAVIPVASECEAWQLACSDPALDIVEIERSS